MSGRTAAAFIILLLLLKGLQAQDGWSVTYVYSSICAVRGSTVTISCTFTHPSGLNINSRFWFRFDRWVKDLESDPEYSGRVESVCDDQNKCSLTIRNLRESDSSVYRFRITSDIEHERWIGDPGVSLRVTDLQLIRSSQSLDCSSCSQTRQPSCIWSKNGEKILENFYYSANDFIDSTCVIGGGENPGQTDEGVVYPSTNICAFRGSTVDISIDSTWASYWSTFWTRKDSDVDLSSNSLQSYKCSQSRLTNTNKFRKTLTITNVSESDSAVYKIWIRSPQGDWRSPDQLGVRLIVAGSEPELQIHVSSQRAEQSRNQTELTCVSQCGDSLQSSYIWYQNDETLPGQTGRTVVLQSPDAAGRFSCALPGHQTLRSPAVYAPEGPSVSVSPSAEVEEDTSVTLSCSSDANPAASYSWFKEGEESPRSSEQSFTITNVRAEDRGTYFCHVWNLMGHNQSTVEVTVASARLQKVLIGSAVGTVLLGLMGVSVVWFVRKKKTEQQPLVKAAARGQDTPGQLGEDNLHYASIHFSKEPAGPSSKVNASGPQELDQVEEGGDVEYSQVRFHRARTTAAAGTGDSCDVIYSSVKQ